METQEVRWEHYPRVATHPETRFFVERLVLKGKRPKTVDAYARAIEDLCAYFSKQDVERLLEADEADLDGYITSLKRADPKKRGRGGMIEDHTNICYLTERKLSENTIAQQVVACRLFYDFLIRKSLRSDPINPIARGNAGRDGQRPMRGPVRKHERLPWVPTDKVWYTFVRHVLLHEDARTKAMILLAYDAALRREELMSLRVDDIDWGRGIVTIYPETSKGGRMRLVPVSACILHLVRTYIEGDRRALIAAYDGEDTGPFSSQSLHGILATRSLWEPLTRSWSACGRRLDCPHSPLTPYVTNAVRCSNVQESISMTLRSLQVTKTSTRRASTSTSRQSNSVSAFRARRSRLMLQSPH